MHGCPDSLFLSVGASCIYVMSDLSRRVLLESFKMQITSPSPTSQWQQSHPHGRDRGLQHPGDCLVATPPSTSHCWVFIHIHAVNDVQCFRADGRTLMEVRLKLEDKVAEGKPYLTQKMLPRSPRVFLTMRVTTSAGSVPKGGPPPQA